MASVTQPFVVGLSQVGSDDLVGGKLQATIDGYTVAVAYGTPRTVNEPRGYTTSVVYGSIVPAGASGPFTVGTSAVGGQDQIGQTGGLQVQNAIGYSVFVGYGAPSNSLSLQPFTVGLSQVGGGDEVGVASSIQPPAHSYITPVVYGVPLGRTKQAIGYSVAVNYGAPGPRLGTQGTFGYGLFGDGFFGGITPIVQPSSAFTVGASAVGDVDEVGGQPQPSQQSATAGGFVVPITYGVVGTRLTVTPIGFAVPVNYGDVSATQGSTSSAEAIGYSVPVVYGTPAVVQRSSIAGFTVPVVYGTLGTPVQLVHPIGYVTTVVYGDLLPVPGPVAVDLTDFGYVVDVLYGTPGVELHTPLAGFVVPVVYGTPGARMQAQPIGYVVRVDYGTPHTKVFESPVGYVIDVVYGIPGSVLHLAPEVLSTSAGLVRRRNAITLREPIAPALPLERRRTAILLT